MNFQFMKKYFAIIRRLWQKCNSLKAPQIYGISVEKKTTVKILILYVEHMNIRICQRFLQIIHVRETSLKLTFGIQTLIRTSHYGTLSLDE
jgi:hypothetical protein